MRPRTLGEAVISQWSDMKSKDESMPDDIQYRQPLMVTESQRIALLKLADQLTNAPLGEPAPIELTPEDWAKLDTSLDKPFPPPSFTREQTQALIELADERLFAKARAAEQDQPERRRTYDEILAELRERLRAGEKVVMPYIYPGLTWAQTRWIGRTLRQLSTDEPSCGVLHDPYHVTSEGAA